MPCKLCLKDKQLLQKSHIIPDFMYKDIFDEKHRLHEVIVTKDKDLKDILRQAGGYEGQILCQSCDNEVLGKLESYARLALYGGAKISMQHRVNEKGIKFTFCEKIDYSKFKLFLLSLLWRASISKLPMFKNIKLGPHEDKIRKMILHNNPDESKKYPCVMALYRNLKETPHKFIGQPGVTREGGRYTYLFFINGVLYVFFVSQHNIPDWVNDYAINSNGELKLIHMTKKMASTTFNKFIGVD